MITGRTIFRVCQGATRGKTERSMHLVDVSHLDGMYYAQREERLVQSGWRKQSGKWRCQEHRSAGA
jgi:hypothetical protein